MKYTFIKDYKNDDVLRKSFNELTQKIFCFNFIDWYSNGFWGEKYIPYSLADGNKIIANISVNIMNFDMDGEEKHYIQLGTVMTDESYRSQGLSRYIMENILDEYKDKVEGIYLFGNDSVLNFYPKFGFTKGKEYKYSKRIYSISNEAKAEHIDMSDKANREFVLDAIENSVSNDRLTMDNIDLIAFWITGDKNDSVYYLPEEKAYIIADVNEETLFIHQIIADHKVDLENVIHSFGSKIQKVTLGFTPYDEHGYSVEEFHEEDCTFFILGKDLENIEKKKLRFPTLSHA